MEVEEAAWCSSSPGRQASSTRSSSATGASPVSCACDDLGGERLFTYRDGDEAVEVRSDDVNDYLREVAGPGDHRPHFRTWGGTVAVVEALGPHAPPEGEHDRRRLPGGGRRAAERLGNTRRVPQLLRPPGGGDGARRGRAPSRRGAGRAAPADLPAPSAPPCGCWSTRPRRPDRPAQPAEPPATS
ncbi:MAG: hypothetical protein R2711_18965 [Acidimicrobiales bacterium]